MSKRKQHNENKFNFFVETELTKGKNEKGEDVVFIDGIASSVSEDSDGETLYPIGFNLQPLLERGLINYNHQGSKDSNAVVGIPLEAYPVNDGKDLYFKGMLWDCDQTRGILRINDNFKKYSPNRKIGYSIEGNATMRASSDKNNPLYKQILKADITGVAVTCSPKCKNTLMNIVKGDYDEPFMDTDDDIEDDDVKTCPKCDHDQLVKGKCLECGYQEKAIDTAALAPAMPESVEHNPKEISNKKVSNFGELLKKSDIYTLIAQKHPASTIAQQKNIYSFVEQVNKKIFKMEGTQISSEALSKAFQLLDEADSLIKGNTQGEIKDQDANADGNGDKSHDWDSDDMKKSVEMASFLSKAGMDKDAACDTMTKGGFSLEVAQASWERALSQMQAAKDGGNISEVSPVMKSEEVVSLIENKVNPINEAISKGFEGLGTIVKSLQETNASLIKKNELLEEKLEKIASQPQGRKSAGGAGFLDRFNKSTAAESNDPENCFNVKDVEDLNRLSDRLLVEHTNALEKGRKDDAAMFEGVVNSIEISKSVPQYAFQRLAQLGIKLQAPSIG